MDVGKTKAKENRLRLLEKKKQRDSEPSLATLDLCADILLDLEAENHPQKTTGVASTQTDLQGEIFPSQAALSIDKLKFNSSLLHYYTGLENFNKFCMVFNTLINGRLPQKNQAIQNCQVLTQMNQFLLFMIKLRRNTPNIELSFLFNVSETSVRKIFTIWLLHSYTMWKKINIWPSRKLVDFYMPEDFKKKFPFTRIILDATEIAIEKPKDPTLQRATFSHYKNRNTLKVMVGMSPGGMITYISPAYGGATSDRQIIARSDLFQKLEKGDSIMADRGLNVQDLFAPYGVQVNIPTFMKGKNQLPGLVVKRDRRIASKRVHIERIIGLGKTFKILSSPLKACKIKFGSEIVFVCFFLCNFKKTIVGKKA